MTSTTLQTVRDNSHLPRLVKYHQPCWILTTVPYFQCSSCGGGTIESGADRERFTNSQRNVALTRENAPIQRGIPGCMLWSLLRWREQSIWAECIVQDSTHRHTPLQLTYGKECKAPHYGCTITVRQSNQDFNVHLDPEVSWRYFRIPSYSGHVRSLLPTTFAHSLPVQCCWIAQTRNCWPGVIPTPKDV